MLAPWVIEILRCPETGQRLEATHGALRRADGRLYADRDGIASLVFPVTLSADDAKMNRLYERIAPVYDWSERVLGRLLTGVDMRGGRAAIVALLGLRAGMRLLEVSPGPGVFLPLLRQRLGSEAQLAALDLSLAMLRQCRARHAALGVELIQGNAQYLPFADESFDALFHFGGVNLFNDPGRALGEFVRVVRRGGVVAWGDEQMSARFRHPLGRWLLPKINPGFVKSPPPVPAALTAVQRHEVYEGLGYLVTARR
jgi:ubiquinone/menaquinone biosynthesis C-methylase UbiE